jgi:hypothetical protein
MRDRFVLFFVNILLIFIMRREWVRFALCQIKNGTFSFRVACPRLANEKFFWRKAIDHDPRFVIVTDKQAAKEWVAASLGKAVCMPKTLWVGTDASKIPTNVDWPKNYIKATHGCNMNIGPSNIEITQECNISTANSFLHRRHGARRREWAYSMIPPRLIVEENIACETGLIELKMFTYGPIVEHFFFINRGPPQRGASYSREHSGSYKRSETPTSLNSDVYDAPLPGVWLAAIEIAKEIGALFDHVRVDFLTDGEKLYLGELTIYHNAGTLPVHGYILDSPLNRSWDIRRSWFLTTPQTGWRKIYADALRRTLNRQFAA